MGRTLILGTRGSKLAMTQSEMIADRLRELHPGLAVELRVISTKGDRVLDVALSAVGDKGLFVKELEQALLDHEVDLCVHSCKDLPSQLPAGLTLVAFPERADSRDVLVFRAKEPRSQGAKESLAAPLDPDLPISLADLPHGAVVGTSSLRRACQLRALRPDLVLRDVRGNVDTRLRKLAAGDYEVLVLAAAGLTRLGLLGADGHLKSDGVAFVAHPVPTAQMLPAVAQGTLAIECRDDDVATVGLLAPLDHAPTRAAALAERAFLRRLEGGCQVPIAAYAECRPPDAKADPVGTNGSGGIWLAGPYILHLRGLVGSLDGLTVVRGELSGAPEMAEVLGTALGGELIRQGAGAILAELAGH